jgi:hypothetical protein
MQFKRRIRKMPNKTPYTIMEIINTFFGEEVLFWDGEYFYSTMHSVEITYDRGRDWAWGILSGRGMMV